MSSKLTLNKQEFLSFQQGDEHIFKYVYSIYFDVFIQKVFRLCRETAVAEEIVQESFIQLFLNKERLDSADGIYPYLYTVSKRLAISHFRRKVTMQKYEGYLAQQWDEAAGEEQRDLENRDLITFIQAAIDELPRQQRLVYTMNKLEDKTYHEIAKKVGISKHTVRNHIASANKLIRLKLSNLFFLVSFLNFFRF